MFGIEIQNIDNRLLVVNTAGAGQFLAPATPPSHLTGPVGLALERRGYQHMYGRWICEADQWWCGQQDHYGDLMDWQRGVIRELGSDGLVRFDEKRIADELMAHA